MLTFTRRNLTQFHRWVVYSRLLNETLIIETNSCGATDNVLIDVKVTPGLYKLFSIKGCTYHKKVPLACALFHPKKRLETRRVTSFSELYLVLNINIRAFVFLGNVNLKPYSTANHLSDYFDYKGYNLTTPSGLVTKNSLA